MPRSPSQSDQPNGRERLLEAAITLFGRDGFDGTSVRAVADEAGVSWGLVRFYFQSKQGLLDAAEKHVMSVYIQLMKDANSVQSAEELVSMIEMETAGLSRTVPFLRRAIMEERPVAIAFLRELLATAEALFAETRARFPDERVTWDPVRAVIHRVGYLLLAPQIGAILGHDLFSVEAIKERNRQDARIAHLTELGIAAERDGSSRS